MQRWPEPQRDSFDLWLSWVLQEGTQAVQPSPHIWQQIARQVRASQLWELWLGRRQEAYTPLWPIGMSQPDRYVVDRRVTSIGWWVLYFKPLSYA
jgi:hypothetical protein